MTTSNSATSEMQQFLSVPPPDFAAKHQPHNVAAIAHANLQSLRDSGDVNYLFYRCTIELSNKAMTSNNTLSPQEEELLFHCITGTRHVLLAKWKAYSIDFRRGVRDYFLALGIQSTLTTTTATTFSRTIRMALFNAAASFWKRSWVQDLQQATSSTTATTMSNEEKTLLETIHQTPSIQLQSLTSPMELFQYLDTLLQQGPFHVMAASSFLGVMIGEFAGKSASNYNMPLEFHKQAHKAFEHGSDATALCPIHRCLQMSMQTLSQLVPALLESRDAVPEEVALSVIQLTTDIIGWEWGTDAWDSGFPHHVGGRALLRPPANWRDMLLQPDFLKALFQVHVQITNTSPGQIRLLHGIRQLVLLMASLTGPMFQNASERKQFASLLLEGVLTLLSTNGIANTPDDVTSSNSLLVDTLSMVSRLFINYKLSILVELPQLSSLFHGIAGIGRQLLHDNLNELQTTAGDLELMEHREWREEALALMVEGFVMVCGDPWLLYSGSEEARQAAQASLAGALGPLYVEFVTIRTQMARLEEMYLMAHEAELDEVREEIFAVDLEEEMASLANVGRLDLNASLSCLSGLFQQIVPKLESFWNGNSGVVTPEAAGLLEESRLITMYIGHLLTDENEGETPVIPDSIVVACQHNHTVTQAIQSAVQTLHQFAQFQASKISENPADPRLSPLLAKSFLWFFHRWAPSYILPVDYGAAKQPSSIMTAWSSPETVQESVSFVVTLCLHYHCYWPHEPQVQEHSALVLHAMAKRCKQLRLAMVSTASFQQLVAFHCLTSGIRHSAPQAEVEATVHAKAGSASTPIKMLLGYQRLPYSIKSKIVTAIMVGCSEHDHEASKNHLNDCLKAIHDSFSSLVHVLSTKQASPDSVDAKEMACLCVELYGGVARAGDMVASERIPQFLTPALPHLSGLMAFYATDLSICESLLRLFRDYAEQFIAVLDSESCQALFQTSGELLKSYSAVHCSSKRVIVHSAEEEQNYNDILCAIQLLIQLGTKDFIDVGDRGMDPSQVTDMIFFGLQQILPLMTRGLLQFPSLCSQYFSLVGFMMETYPDKVGILPYELFDALLESLLFGMSYHDATVAKTSLQGIAGIVKEHLTSRVLNVHLGQNPDLLDKCSKRLLMEVVFQSNIWDRLEAACLALLPLAASDLNRFAAVVQSITHQIPPEHQPRLRTAFEGLLRPEVLSRVQSTGYEGRQNRIQFKKNFEGFCHEIHSFLILK